MLPMLLPALLVCLLGTRSFAAAGTCLPKIKMVFAQALGSVDPCCGDSRTTPCGTLHAALLRADTGATIAILPGNLPTSTAPLTAPLQLGSLGLTLLGEGAGSIIDCLEGACLAASCSSKASDDACALTLRELTVTRGSSTAEGGCLSSSGTRLSVSDVTFSKCTAVILGGGVAVNSGSASLTRVSMLDCTVPESSLDATFDSAGGGGLSITSAPATLTAFSASNCQAPQGSGGSILVSGSQGFKMRGASTLQGGKAQLGGCLLTYSSTVSITGATFSDCQATSGGGMYDYGSSVTIQNTRAVNCVANKTADFSLNTQTFALGGGLYLASNDATVISSNVSGCASSDYGGGIEVQATTASLTDLIFVNNSAVSCGGALSVDGNVTVAVDACTFRNNSATDEQGSAKGGAVSLSDVVEMSIRGSTFTGNSAPYSTGGALYLTLSTDKLSYTPVLSVESSTFSWNQAYAAGVFASDGCQLSFSNCTFSDNTASFTGVALVQVESAFTNCTFSRNSGTAEGGALSYKAIGTLLLDTCKFLNNTVGTGDGGALWAYSGEGRVVVRRSIFQGNQAVASRGGAIFSSVKSLELQASNFSGNTAFLRGGALAVTGAIAGVSASRCIFKNNSSPVGGGALLLGTNATGALRGCTLEGSNSTQGGAILVQEYATLSISGSTCQSNTALSGGCIALRDFASVSAVNSHVLDNVAMGEGAAASLTTAARMTMQRTKFWGNSALSGGCFWQEMRSFLKASYCDFTGNSATFVGGVLYATHNAESHLSHSTVNQNRALRGGAVAADALATLSVLNTTFSNNSQSALVLQGGANASVSASHFSANTAGEGRSGGALLASDAVYLALTTTDFYSNQGLSGGALYLDGTAQVNIKGGNFSANSANASGGAVAVDGSAAFSAAMAVFDRNTAGSSGGGVAILGRTSGLLTSCQFFSNRALVDGAGVFLDRTVGSGDTTTQPAAASASKTALSSKNALDRLSRAEMNVYAGVVPRAPRVVTPGSVLCSGLFFSNNSALVNPGSAFFDSSYHPSSRVECTGCTTADESQQFSTPPTSLNFSWPGESAVNPAATPSSFTLLSAVGSPVEGLRIILLDAYGQPMPQDNSSIGRIIPTPQVSGVLTGTARQGVISMPPVYPAVSASEATSFLLQVHVASPVAAYPDVLGVLNMSFCPNGTFFNSTTFTCDICTVGSWCAAGQPMVPCPDGSFSFYPGAYDQDANCTACDDSNLDCTGGVLTISQQAWLDPTSIDSSPSTYSCVTTNGCNGSTYTSPQWQQCLGGFNQSSYMCCLCESNWFSILGKCNPCSPTFKTLFPLLLVLVILVWVGFLILGELYEAFGVFLEEVQYLCIIASVNLNPPAGWVYKLIQVYNLAIFDIDIIGPGCVMTYEYPQYFFLILIVAATGLLYYAVRFLTHSVRRIFKLRQLEREEEARERGREKGIAKKGEEGLEQEEIGLNELQIEVDYRNSVNAIISGAMSWLDTCYIGIAQRCLPVFVSQQVGDVWVMFWAPNVHWGSTAHTLMLAVAVVLTVLYIAGMPLAYAWLVFSAKRDKTLFTPDFQERFGFLTESFKRKFYWWYFVTVAWRIIFVIIVAFLESNAAVQITLIVSLQVLRIAGEYRFAPLSTTSIELMRYLMDIGGILFSLSLVSFNYLGLEAFSNVLMAVSTAFVVLPGVVAILFDFLNTNIARFNEGVMERAWEEEQEKHEDDFRFMDPRDVIELSYVAAWFRPHILFAALLQDEALPLLLKVRERFQAACIEGLADDEWVNQLKKPQQYGGLAQVLLGNRVGHIVVAQVPVGGSFCEEHGVWHADGVCPSSGFRGQDCDIAILPHGEVDVGPTHSQDKAEDDGGDVVREAVKLRRRGKGGKAGGKLRDGKGKPEDSWPVHLGGNVSWRAADDTAIGGDLGEDLGSQSIAVGRDLSFGPSMASGRGVGVSMGMSARMASRRQTMPRELWSVEDFVEARLDMAELTFAFQRNLGQLVKREKKSKQTDEALRYLLHATSVHIIFSWFTCPGSTPEDQQLFARLVTVVRKAVEQEAGGPGLFKGIWCFYKNRPRLQKKRLAQVQGSKEQ